MVSTFAGAWGAYRFEAYKESQAKKERELDALRSALFAFALQRNFLLGLGRQVLAPYRDNPHRSFLIIPALGEQPAVSVDLSSLLFLLGGKEAQILNTLQLADQEYRLVIGILERRNALHYRMQDHIAAVADPNGNFHLEDLEKAAGPAFMTQILKMTDQLYEMQESALGTSREAHRLLEEHTKARFPKAHVPTITERDRTLPPEGATKR